MKIYGISIRNFKSFGDEPIYIPFSDTTALVGANSSGKTNVLKALDVFFDFSKKKVTEETFHNRDLYKPIEISVTFCNLSDGERKNFRSNISPDGYLRIKQRIWIPDKKEPSINEGGNDGNDIDRTLSDVLEEKRGIQVVAVPEVIDWLNLENIPSKDQVNFWCQNDLVIGDLDLRDFFQNGDIPSPEDFKSAVDLFWEENGDDIPQIEWLNDKSPSKTKIKNWWKGNMKVGDEDFKDYFEDKNAIPDPETFSESVNRFWEDQWNHIPIMRHEASQKVLGWANKLKGNLPRLIYMPAIRHIHEEIKVAKTNPFGMMLYWLLGDIPKSRKDEIQERISKAIEDAFAQSPELDEEKRRIDLIRETINVFINEQFDLSVDFEFAPPKLDDLLSGNVNIIGDDGFRSHIQEKGQGVQRSLMFAILRTYCEHWDKFDGAEKRNSIFAIEEPELCLHPAVKRATYNLLRMLSEREDQVVYSTHDGYFVDVRHFDEVRVLRRIKQSDGKWCTSVSHFPFEHLITDAKNRYGLDITAESIRENFGRFYDPAKNEGFFARKVVLVEGLTEEYSLPIYFKSLNFDTDQEQVAIISAGSVQHLDYLYIVFNELGIPCYVIFDGDKPRTEPFDPSIVSGDVRRDLRKKSRRNKDLLNLLGLSDQVDEDDEYFFPRKIITEHVAVFEHEFEVEVQHPLPEYEKLKSEATEIFGNDSKPLIARYIARQISQDVDHIPEVIKVILDNVKLCTFHGSCLFLD
jgi:putative ATP-dependent endonuclease of OLD family